jgi:secreted trypsin-like serine protease
VVEGCAFPTVVRVDLCSGVLVDPGLVLTAAHCIQDGAAAAYVHFGDNHLQSERTVPAACHAHPEYDGQNPAFDIAYCALDEPVVDLPLIPILEGCEADALQVGQQVELVGFGMANDGLGPGPKRQVTAQITDLSSQVLQIGGGGLDTCFGDSGGPVLVPLADGSWRVGGLTSRGDNCGDGGEYVSLPQHVDWIESQSGLDLTPCYDQHGNWSPSGSCSEVPVAPELSAGDWETGCSGGPTVVRSEVCEGRVIQTEAEELAHSCSVAGTDFQGAFSLALALVLMRSARQRSSKVS